ncbi:MAG: hypothetical protein IT385_07510 [Deltaproteobacteria bacterium]|nr:hypothetical protein [Deltaproteobacteria bacterium]
MSRRTRLIVAASSVGLAFACGGDDGARDVASDADLETTSDVDDTSDATTEAEAGSDAVVIPPPCTPAHPPEGIVVVEDGRYRRISGVPTPDGLPARDVTVYLPATYDAEAGARFPVLYMHDGQNLFDPEASAFGEWGVDEVLDGLVDAGLAPATIVVGVHNTGERIADYTPTPMDPHGGGNAAAYADWLVGTLKPIVDQRFRTRCEREHTTIAGSSLGGLVTLFIGMRHPDHVARLGVVSPSLWWDEGKLLDEWEAWEGPLPDRLWVDMGTGEEPTEAPDDLPYGVDEVRRVVERALARGMVYGRDVALLEDLGAIHNEGAWRARLPAILGFLLSEHADGGFAAFGAERALQIRLERGALYLDVRPGLPVIVEVTAGARPRLGRMSLPPSLAPLAASGAAAALDADALILEGLAAGDVTLSALWVGQGLTAERVVSVYGAGLVPVGFDVKRPTGTPADAVVHVVGDAPGLGAGDPGAVPLARNGDRWIGERPLATDQGFTYNYTLGSEATWEADELGLRRAPRTHGPPDPTGATVVIDRIEGWLGLE